MTTNMRSRSRTLGVVLLLVTFVAGAAAGISGDRLVSARKITIKTRVASDMSGVLDRLGLTPEQRVQADSIIARSAPRTEEVMREVATRLRDVADSVDRELRAVLTPTQRTKLDSLRHEPTFMLKRKKTGTGTTVDTLFPRRR
jgi:Spy/CpxP family protein refolding chaperone